MANDNNPAQFRQKPSRDRKKMWFGAMKMSRTGKAGYAEKTARMLDEYKAIELASARPEANKSVGALMFERHGHGFVSFGFAQGGMVAAIRKIVQHRHADNRVYQVNVLGQAIPITCRSIEEARELDAFEYTQFSGESA